MADQQILKEYLLALGFKLDETEGKKFDKAISGFDFNVTGLAKKLLAAGTAAQVMVGLFARSMEKLYYASQRTNTTVENIQALDYAAGQVGVSADSMRSSLEGMARALRSNPGLADFLKDLRVPVEGRQTSDILVDLVEQLGKMPFYQASQIGSMFGINPDDLLLLIKAGSKLREAMELRRQMNADAGLDADAAAKAGEAYDHMLRRIVERITTLKNVILVDMLPGFTKAAEQIERAILALTKWYRDVGPKKELSAVPENAKKMGTGYWEYTKWFYKRLFGLGGEGAAPGAQAPAAPSSQGAADLFSKLEKQFGLPEGLLDKMWLRESSRGKRMLSPAGAKGHFGFMDPTAKEMGLKDPNDLAESARAAAEYMSRLMKRYGGDLQTSLAAYNWGMGNVQRYGLGAAPWETRNYVREITGQPLQATQINHFHIKANDPAGVARETSLSVDRTWSDITRNAAGGNIQ